MIVLNSTKDLVRIENWEDVEARPGFTKDLNPREHELASIIGRYAFPERIHCGLSNCHTLHAKGYIVATKDGHETNIGKDCGKTYFGVDFETMSRKFDQDITDKENRERLGSLLFRVDEVKQQIQDLRKAPNGADWVFHTARPLVEPGRELPNELVHQIATMVKTRQSLITVSREATAEEHERLEVERGRQLPRPQYVDEPIGQLDGLEALYPENDLRQLLVFDLEQELAAFEALDIDSMTSSDLRRWNKWAGTIEPTMERAGAAVEAGQRLLRRENLLPLARLVRDKEQASRVSKFANRLPG